MTATCQAYRTKKEVSKARWYYRFIMCILIVFTLIMTTVFHYANMYYEAQISRINLDLRREFQYRYKQDVLLMQIDQNFRMMELRSEAYKQVALLEEELADVKAQLEEKQAREAQLASIQLTSSPFTVSNLTGDQFNLVIESLLDRFGISHTENLLYQTGYALEQMEKTYGVNGIFVMAVSWMESGSRTSDLARSHNNMTSIYGGDGLNTYSSPSECIINTGRILKDNYYTAKGCRTASDIGPIYCPPNPNWANSITSFCNTIIHVAEDVIY